MIKFKDSYILGWNSPSVKDSKKLKDITVENQFDVYNHPNWIWLNYPEGKPIYSPKPYTPEQEEDIRKNEVRAEIRKLYSVEDEIKIQRQNINALMKTDGTQTDEYFKYNNDVEKIILNSQKKDFQIGEKNVSK